MSARRRIEKLVRDLIPEIIRRDGGVPIVRRVDDPSVRPFVAYKLLEEALEACEAMLHHGRDHLRLELADLLEVMERAMSLSGLSFEEVRATQLERRQARGAFQDNILLSGPLPPFERLYTGHRRPLVQPLRAQLEHCTRAHFAVSFILSSGIKLILQPLKAALERGARVRIVTTDYLDITEPEALETLLSLPGDLQLRAYCEPARSYHPKAYLFEHEDQRGVAFVGSSNLSRFALEGGVEWNYEVKALDAGWPLNELLTRFEELFASEYCVPIDAEFVARYRRERQPRSFAEEDAIYSRVWPPLPNRAQLEALEQLKLLRDEGESKGLVIAATGIGKTYLAAFDSRGFERVLFVAHREELLRQAHASFEKVRPEARLGFYNGEERNQNADILFASVATLSRRAHLENFPTDRFDYLVIDEFHHAEAKSYRAILDHFAPKFLLGLTATPYRGDNRDVFALCDGNVPYKVTFLEAIAFGWLAPFHYFGIHDATNYEDLPRSNGRYQEEELGRALANEQRANAILEAYRRYPSGPGLGFCVNIGHAKFMADHFTRHGVKALAVHSGADSIDRQQAIQQLRSATVAVLFTVDLFNEGVDIPEVDLVMFLRPTESVTVFLQQLGRGLRLHPCKEYLTVLDFIGNYQKAHYKVAILTGQVEAEPEGAELRPLIAAFDKSGRPPELPEGVEIHFEHAVIDLMQQLLKRQEPWRQRLIQGYHEAEAHLGHPPTLLELHLWGRHDVRQYLREFKRWNLFLQTVRPVTPGERQLEEEVGHFLAELERTAMTRSYKMVVLKWFVLRGGLEAPVEVAELAAGFRGFFLESSRHARDIAGTKVEAIGCVSEELLCEYLAANPLDAWTNTGKEGKRTTFFVHEKEVGLFRYLGPKATDPELFAQAVLERVNYRLDNHFAVRYERKNLFKVIEAGDNREKGIIHLGTDQTAPIPRNQGWKAVLIGRHRLYAKFAKIAINVLKTAAVDDKEVPNRLTEVLEELFGPGGYRSERMNRVRIRPAAGEPDVWVIEAMRIGGAGAP